MCACNGKILWEYTRPIPSSLDDTLLFVSVSNVYPELILYYMVQLFVHDILNGLQHMYNRYYSIISSENVQRLVNLGYSRKVCEFADQISDHHFERAKEWLNCKAEDWMRFNEDPNAGHLMV